VVIGTRANVETTKAMVDYLVSAIERLARESDLPAFATYTLSKSDVLRGSKSG
jgi:hypothetical protein